MYIFSQTRIGHKGYVTNVDTVTDIELLGDDRIPKECKGLLCTPGFKHLIYETDTYRLEIATITDSTEPPMPNNPIRN